jgi:hypothetical protein
VERALTEALSQWRVSRCEQLALNIDALHEHLVRTRPQFPDGRWLQVCARRREEDLPGLLSSLPPVAAPSFGPRLDALRAFPPNPHLAQVLRWALEERDDLAEPASRALWRRVLATLAWVGDPRTKGWLPALAASQRGGTVASRAWLQREVATLSGSLPIARAAAPAPFVLPGAPMLGELTDAERLVTADWLSGFDDPLGEFLVLQCQPLHDEQARRMRALQVRHARRWLGPLSRALRLDRLVFERGVVVEGTLGGVRALETSGHASWCSVRSLDLRALRNVDAGRIVRFLREPVLRGLRVLTGLTEGVVAELAHGAVPFQLERMQVIQWQPGELRRLLGLARSLRSLRLLDLNGTRWVRGAGGEWQKE